MTDIQDHFPPEERGCYCRSGHELERRERQVGRFGRREMWSYSHAMTMGGAHIISASRTVLLLAYSLTRTGDGFDGDRDGGCSGVPREG